MLLSFVLPLPYLLIAGQLEESFQGWKKSRFGKIGFTYYFGC